MFFNWIKNLFSRPKRISSKKMLDAIDDFQEQYNVDEEELNPMFRNEDKKDWYKKDKK